MSVVDAAKLKVTMVPKIAGRGVAEGYDPEDRRRRFFALFPEAMESTDAR